MTADLESLKRGVARELFGITLQEAHLQSICIKCKDPIVSFVDHISAKEYGISGLCQKCQDEIFTGRA